MAIKARMSKTYMWRLAIFSAVFLFYAFWSAWDGFVHYPQINAHAKVYQQFKTDHPDDWKETWPDYAKQNSLPIEPEEAKGDFSMYAQYVQLVITLPIGLISLFSWLRGFKRWVAIDEKNLSTDAGDVALFTAITKLNKERWKTKGIAVVTYQSDDGLDRKIILDDWKYDTQPTRDILVAVESHLTKDKIVGGDPEPLPSATPSPDTSLPSA